MANVVIARIPHQFSKQSFRGQCILAVGKNIEKKATGRNKIKRRLRSILRPLLRKEKNIGIRVLVKPGVTKLSFEELKQEVLRAWERMV